MGEDQNQEISIVTICLGLYFALMVFDSIPMFGIGSILRILILLPVGAVLVIKLRHNLELNAQIILAMAYCFFLSCSYLYSINRAETFKQVSRVLLNIAVIISVSGMYDYNEREIEFLKKSLAVGGIITILLTLMLADRSASGRLSLSVNGAVQDQNFLNGYIFYAYILFLDGLFEKKKVAFLLPVGGILLFTLMTGSRGALLALAGISMTVILYIIYKNKRFRISTLVMIALGFLLVLLLYKPVLSLLPEEVSVRFTPEYIEEYGNTGRSEIWKYLLNRFASSNVFRTLFGYGFGTVAYLNEYNHLVAHNLWIEHLLAVGVIGEISFVAMQIAFIRAAWKTKDIFVISAYAGYLIMMLSLSLLTYKPIWNCMMMILIISRKQQAGLKEEDNADDFHRP